MHATTERGPSMSRTYRATVKRLLAAACAAATLSSGTTLGAEPGAGTGTGTESAAIASETDLPLLARSIRANRRALLGVNLALDESEAAKFWPLYDEYEKALAPIGDRMAKLVQEYIRDFRTMSNEKALELIRAYGDSEMARMQVRRSFLDRFAEILPGRTVARFYQIENKMDAVLRYDLAATIPVVEEKASAPGTN